MVGIVARHLARMGTDAEQSGELRERKDQIRERQSDQLQQHVVTSRYNADVSFETGLAITGMRVLQRDCSGGVVNITILVLRFSLSGRYALRVSLLVHITLPHRHMRVDFLSTHK
jgi:hypothetical protein